MRLILIALLALPLVLTAPAARADTAIFAGGCFWCVEHDLEVIPGITSAVSGYTGGAVKNPTYEQVVTETTGHYEAVKITFDPKRISYAAVLDRYWKLVDPTDAGGQFCDRGPSYRTAVFVSSPAQRAEAEASKARAANALKTGVIATPILPAQTFWPAEGYHQQYAVKNPLRYSLYRQGCGRDARLRQVWR
jgi:peptide-methionine (S)-S-oxide reductase